MNRAKACHVHVNDVAGLRLCGKEAAKITADNSNTQNAGLTRCERQKGWTDGADENRLVLLERRTGGYIQTELGLACSLFLWNLDVYFARLRSQYSHGLIS